MALLAATTVANLHNPGMNESDSAPGLRLRTTRRLLVHFYLSMLAVAAIDSCFAIIYEVPFSRFAPTALLLVLFTLGGAFIIFEPVRQYLRNPEAADFPARRIATLASVCTAYMAAVVSVLAAVKFLILPELFGFDIGSVLTPTERLWLPVLHTLYYTGLIYFVMLDYGAVLRFEVFRSYARQVSAGRGRLLYRLLAAFGVTSLLPMSFIVLHAFERDMTYERYALIQDVMASALGLCVTVIFVTRSLLRPIRSVEKAIARVRKNDLSVTLPILSNDETGQLASGFNRMVRGLRERALIRQTFGRYIPERVASAIVASGGQLRPRSAIATVLYADIEDFTTIAEKISPERVIEMLNQYFTRAVDLIEKNNGVVTQFQGDAMLVTFNLPVEDQRHAESAIRAALDIQQRCAEETFAGIKLRVRIGIATGAVTAGSVGSENRMSYTVHGDAVNLAARLEKHNKRFGSFLLIDEATIKLLTLPMPVKFVGEVQIRGKEQFVRVYRHDIEANGALQKGIAEAGGSPG